MARRLLERLGTYTELRLEHAGLLPLTRDTLEHRSARIAKGDYSDPSFDYAKQFAQADVIVIAAPFWDLSFPALLKTYIEHIYVTGIVSKYGSDGRPIGLCRAKKLYYVTTAGGPYDGRFSYDCLKEMAQTCFGIQETQLIYADMLDVDGYDAEEILKNCMEKI